MLFMRKAFEKAGLGQALRGVEDGQQAINYLSGSGVYADRGQHPLPALLLLDLNLPVISGFALLQWLRGRAEFQALPVVIFTSSSREADKLKARELGANDYLEKPSSGVHFIRVVEWLRDKWLRRAEGK